MPPKAPAEQARILAEFKKEVVEEQVIPADSDLLTDWNLARFLRARQYNFKNAKLMLQNCEKWRKSVGGNGIDDLYRRMDPFDYPERPDVFKHWPLWFHKVDKKGRPVNVHSFGSINVSELHKIISPERHLDSLYVSCESLTREVLPASASLAQRPIETVLVIVDLKGFSLSQFWQMKDLARLSFEISQDYYPETMGQLKIINAPLSFTSMWSVVKPWLARETVDKVDILGSNYATTLLSIVDAENLPASFGGKCECPGGCQFSSVGPWLADRQQRREAWLKGEREHIALRMDERPDVAGLRMERIESPDSGEGFDSMVNVAGGNVTPGLEDDSSFVRIGLDGHVKEKSAESSVGAEEPDADESDEPQRERAASDSRTHVDESGEELPSSQTVTMASDLPSLTAAENAARRAAHGLEAQPANANTTPHKRDSHSSSRSNPDSASSPGRDEPPTTNGVGDAFSMQAHNSPGVATPKIPVDPPSAQQFREAVASSDRPPPSPSSGDAAHGVNGVAPAGTAPSAPAGAGQSQAVVRPPSTNQAIARGGSRTPSPSALDNTAGGASDAGVYANGETEGAGLPKEQTNPLEQTPRKMKGRVSKMMSKLMHPKGAQSMSS